MGHELTLVHEPEALAILGVVAVEVDNGLMSRAQERSWKFTAAVLANQCAAVLRSVTHLQEVVVIFSGEIQELDVCSYRLRKKAGLRAQDEWAKKNKNEPCG